jgi:hypothetical protein
MGEVSKDGSVSPRADVLALWDDFGFIFRERCGGSAYEETSRPSGLPVGADPASACARLGVSGTNNCLFWRK